MAQARRADLSLFTTLIRQDNGGTPSWNRFGTGSGRRLDFHSPRQRRRRRLICASPFTTHVRAPRASEKDPTWQSLLNATN